MWSADPWEPSDNDIVLNLLQVRKENKTWLHRWGQGESPVRYDTASTEVHSHRRLVVHPALCCVSLFMPLEVWERVIDNLIGDSQTLYRCALVCRTWYPRSLHNLYIAISISSRRNWDYLSDLLRRVPRLRQQFKTARHLQICDRSTFMSLASTQLFPFILGMHLKALRTLRLTNGTCDQSFPPGFFLYLGQLASLTELTLSAYHIHSGHLTQFVVAFPRLERLVLEDIRVLHPELLTDVKIATASSLRSIVLRIERGGYDECISMHHLINWFIRLPWIRTIQSVQIRFNEDVYEELYNTIRRRVRRWLQQLIYALDESLVHLEVPCIAEDLPYDLKMNAKLRSLHVREYISEAECRKAGMTLWGTIARFLSQITSREIRRIAFGIDLGWIRAPVHADLMHFLSELEKWDRVLIGEVISRKNFKALEDVTIRCSIWFGHDATPAHLDTAWNAINTQIWRMFAAWHERGILHVRSSYPHLEGCSSLSANSPEYEALLSSFEHDVSHPNRLPVRKDRPLDVLSRQNEAFTISGPDSWEPLLHFDRRPPRQFLYRSHGGMQAPR
ncbi:uncharacterized protein LAESUDRAFT_811908 [Laetiporus sulphureus 93-53]|uniref:F-box domain-containing protein n=1 Tax=Laetiporus sulphureus 93-53 TaxID=1314785 RepID=A0A165ES20_9APHY|nr:uncharacterized protein LAESUDRAFT_811908 [Laetiporus sulphureus 93-53]KZT07647.1 hypothetical protein LAESUDRAFT_811908 [Laetiporus sulphureus 93-53]